MEMQSADSIAHTDDQEDETYHDDEDYQHRSFSLLSSRPATHTSTELHHDEGGSTALNGTAWTPPLPSSLSTGGTSTQHPSSASHWTSTANGTPPLDAENLPGQRKSTAAVSLRAWLLGQALGVSCVVAIHLLFFHHHHPLWRIPFFLATLSLFHFLEFWITARFNTRYATVSAFLLSSNGTAYNIAHAAGLIECLLTHSILPTFFSTPVVASSRSLHQPELFWSWRSSSWLSLTMTPWPASVTLLGLFITTLGQFTRSCAMAQAGTNFNHIVQTKRTDDHRLVTTGIYAYLRHPSYFGFFWWGLGTQIVMANRVCLVVYAIVLWRFFQRRIQSMSISQPRTSLSSSSRSKSFF